MIAVIERQPADNRYQIDIPVADDPAAFPWLSRIQQLFEDGWHLWEVLDVEAMLATAWLTDPGYTGSAGRDVLVKTVARSAYPTTLHRARARVTAAPPGALEFTPADDSRFLAQPLVILLENCESDEASPEAIVETLVEDEPWCAFRFLENHIELSCREDRSIMTMSGQCLMRHVDRLSVTLEKE